MNTDRLVSINIKNARAVARGIYSGLLCPRCNMQTVEAFFSIDSLRSRYGIWFECKACENVEHISCRAQPEGFTPLRLSDKYQRLDDGAWMEES